MSSTSGPEPAQPTIRIVLTGGPGGGKTTAADLFRRELGEQVVVVPEAATMLFSGGFPRYLDPAAVRAAQKAIYYVQVGVEDTQAARYPGRILLCDRGTVDGAAYWPSAAGGPGGLDGTGGTGDDEDDFFVALGTTREAELARYDAVIFFESAAGAGISIEGGNAARIEDLDQAVRLDRRLNETWSQHPRFVFVPNNHSFFKKITYGLAAIESIVAQLRRGKGDGRGR